jgi:hypothetical protein
MKPSGIAILGRRRVPFSGGGWNEWARREYTRFASME